MQLLSAACWLCASPVHATGAQVCLGLLACAVAAWCPAGTAPAPHMEVAAAARHPHVGVAPHPQAGMGGTAPLAAAPPARHAGSAHAHLTTHAAAAGAAAGHQDTGAGPPHLAGIGTERLLCSSCWLPLQLPAPQDGSSVCASMVSHHPCSLNGGCLLLGGTGLGNWAASGHAQT